MTWTAPADRDRGLGALWGLALGDALGTTTEFTAPPAPPYPALATGPLDDIVGGGPFSLAPGEVTDDTQLAAALAQSLIVCDGDLDRVDLAARFVDWQRHAFDVGSQIGAALRRLGIGASVDDAEIKARLAGDEPYEEWLQAAQYKLKDLDVVEPESRSSDW